MIASLFGFFIMLAGGIALLVKGADYMVDGASAIARRFEVSSLVIGLTIVAFGTSAPELLVNLISAINGSSDIALGNINGSNIANILLILGIASVFIRIPVKSRTVAKEIPFMLLAGAMLVVLMLDSVLQGTPNLLTRTDGIVLLGFFVIFMYYLTLSALDTRGKAKVEKPKMALAPAVGFTVLGLIGLFLGGKLTVDGAIGVAHGIGVSESLIAVSVVAIGTSLPELVTAIVAARKQETDLAIGGIVGSNIFNILFVLGVTATVSTRVITVSNEVIWDAVIAFAAMIVLLVALLAHRHPNKDGDQSITRHEGLLFLGLYAAYIVYIIARG